MLWMVSILFGLLLYFFFLDLMTSHCALPAFHGPLNLAVYPYRPSQDPLCASSHKVSSNQKSLVSKTCSFWKLHRFRAHFCNIQTLKQHRKSVGVFLSASSHTSLVVTIVLFSCFFIWKKELKEFCFVISDFCFNFWRSNKSCLFSVFVPTSAFIDAGWFSLKLL